MEERDRGLRVVISQPRYLPTTTYLQRLYNADLFVFLDNVQRQSRGVENRNKILMRGKERWLTIPVSSSSRELIALSRIAGEEWVKEHKSALFEAYRREPRFDPDVLELYYDGVEEVLRESGFGYAETLCHLVLQGCKVLGFSPRTVRATELGVPEAKGVENLFNIARRVGASEYVSGANGRQYGVKPYFEERGIRVLFHDPEPREAATQPESAGRRMVWSEFCFLHRIFTEGLERVKAEVKSPWRLSES